MTAWYRREGDDLVLFLHIQPRAGRDAFGKVLDGHRKLHIKAPPVDGKANAHLLRFLAKSFGVRRDDIQIEQGHKGRRKRIRIRGTSRIPKEIL